MSTARTLAVAAAAQAPAPVAQPKPWRTAVERAAREFGYGDTIPKAWLADALGVRLPERGTAAEFQAAQLALLTRLQGFMEDLLAGHQMYLRANHRGGYVVVRPGDQTAVAMERAGREVRSALRAARDAVVHTRVEALTADEARARTDTLAKLAGFELLSGRKLGG